MSRFRSAKIAAALLVGGCAVDEAALRTGPSSLQLATAGADLLDLRSIRVAQAAASQDGAAVRIVLKASGLPAGAYGAHIHAVGRCDAPDFSSAGPHWNPGGQQHGRSNAQGMHLGDLPNLMIGADGKGSLEIAIAGASLSGRSAALLDEDGAAIILHERADDYRTDPSGNSGARIACGIFR